MKSDNNSTNSKIKQQPPEPGLCYILYMHKQNLQRSKATFLERSETKIYMTEALISTTAKNANLCSRDDLAMLSRATIFKKNLKLLVQCFDKYHEIKMREKHEKKLEQQQMQHDQNNVILTTLEAKVKTDANAIEQENQNIHHDNNIQFYEVIN